MKIISRKTNRTMLGLGTRILFSLLILVCITLPFTTPVSANSHSVVPTMSVVSVDSDNTVTIMTYYFPPNEQFTVRMGPYGGLGLDGTVVATTDSGAGGTFQATYTIPDYLKGQGRIAIRMDNPNGYFYSYTWFTNRADVAPTYTPYNYTSYNWYYPYNYNYSSNYYSYYYPYPAPTFTITSVARDSTVTIKTSNFPANEKFTVRMGSIGTKALNGIVVGTTDTGDGGSFEATYNIPDGLKGLYQISIRMDSSTYFYYSYNWFYNNSTYQ